MSNGRKIESCMENPIDDRLLEWCDAMVDKLYQHKITPNMVTCAGIVFRIISIWALFQGYKLLFIIGGAIGYFCDCLDGHLARKYNMTTFIGDLLDHVSDIAFQFAIIVYLFYHRNNPLFSTVIVFYLVFLTIFLVHMGCQQKQFNGNNETLDQLQRFCHNSEWIHYTKFFGSGTFVFFSLMVGILF